MATFEKVKIKRIISIFLTGHQTILFFGSRSIFEIPLFLRKNIPRFTLKRAAHRAALLVIVDLPPGSRSPPAVQAMRKDFE